MTIVSAQDFQDTINSGAPLNILDVRTRLEHEHMSLEQLHEHLPLDEIDMPDLVKRIDQSVPLYILCKAGPRAVQLANALALQGIDNIYVVDGGLMACAQLDMPVTRGHTKTTPEELQMAAKKSYQAFMEKYTA